MAASKPFQNLVLHVNWLSKHAILKVTDNKRLLIVAAVIIIVFSLILVAWLRRRQGKRFRKSKRGSKGKKVNCWFCNTDDIVHITESDGWYCKNCDQYNGFSHDGDYNKEIPEMHAVITELPRACLVRDQREILSDNSFTSGPKLCEACNRMQILKVRQMAAFVPANEAYFDYEVEEYKEHLERRYQLCHNCSLSVKKHLRDQDMQLQQTYGHYDKVYLKEIHDQEENRIEDKQNKGNNRRQKLRWFSYLWPSRLLPLISWMCCLLLFISGLTGKLKMVYYRLVLFGCLSRTLMWLMNPLSKRRFLLLMLWLSLLGLAAVESVFWHKFMTWLRMGILLFESWYHIYSLSHLIVKITWLIFCRLFRIRGNAKTPKRALKKSPKVIRNMKDPGQRMENNPQDNKPVLAPKKKKSQDNINGRISTMSLGLTDSEDETNQVRRNKARKANSSWFTSASKFVTEAEESQNYRRNENGPQQKFVLQPSRLLYPSLRATDTSKEPVAEEKEQRNQSGLHSVTSGNLRQRNIQTARKATEDLATEEETYIERDRAKTSKKNSKSMFLETVKFLLKALVFITLVGSVLLNVYLLRREK